MSVMVIGSNSFSGASFVRWLLRNTEEEVVGVSRSNEPELPFRSYAWSDVDAPGRFRFFQHDLRSDADAIARLAAETGATRVVNFAAQGMVAESWLKPEDWYLTNTVGNILLHDRLRKLPSLEKYVHVSTPEVYGNTVGTIAESRQYNPSTPYATSRAACDMSLHNFLENYRFPVVWTRAANVFGEGQQLYRIIPRTIMAILTGQKLQLHGGGHSVRSFIHIDDVAAATWAIATRAEPGGIYHLSTDRFVSIRDLVAIVCERMGEDLSRHSEPAPERDGKDAAYLLDASKAREEFSWSPDISLEEGIDRTVAWVREHFETLRQMSLHYIHKS